MMEYSLLFVKLSVFGVFILDQNLTPFEEYCYLTALANKQKKSDILNEFQRKTRRE